MIIDVFLGIAFWSFLLGGCSGLWLLLPSLDPGQVWRWWVLGRELLQVSGGQKEMEMSEEGRLSGAVFAPRISVPRQ